MNTVRRQVVLVAGPCAGKTLTTDLPAGTVLRINGEPYLLTTIRTVRGDVAEWRGRTL